MKTSELIKILKAADCYLVRHGHNHYVWFSPISQKKFTVGRHPKQDVPIGTAANSLKEAGIR